MMKCTVSRTPKFEAGRSYPMVGNSVIRDSNGRLRVLRMSHTELTGRYVESDKRYAVFQREDVRVMEQSNISAATPISLKSWQKWILAASIGLIIFGVLTGL